MFCLKPDHTKNYAYCEDCAINGHDAHMVFFCDRCHRDIRMQHQSHVDELKPIEHKKFMQPYLQLKSLINQQINGIKQKIDKKKQSQIDFNEIIRKLKKSTLPYLRIVDDKQKFFDIVRNQQIMKWLLQIKFWQCSVQRSSFMKFEGRFQNHLQQKLISQNKAIQKILKPVQQSIVVQKFSLQWEENDTDERIYEKMEKLKQESYYRKKEQQICNVVIKMFQTYIVEECYDIDYQCVDLLKRYPDSKVLYLCRIRINELLPQGNQQIERILEDIVKNVDKKFQSTDIYHYYKAMTQWEMTQVKEYKQQLIFFQLRNKLYYRMINPDAYIDSMNKAISIRQKPIYIINLGLGYLVKQNYHEALRLFKKANSMLDKKNDSLDANQFWTQTQIDPNYQVFQAIMENLQTRTLQFIVSICKYFKKSQNYHELVVCCQELILRQPNNSNFKIQFIKSILSYSSTLREFQGEKIDQAERMIIELKNAQEASAGQLDKKLKRLRAKHDFNKNQFQKASEGYEELARGTKFTTGSDYYNYAASLLKYFIQDQCTNEEILKKSYEIVIKALNMKPDNKKYKKLKFFICSYMNKFNQANKQFEDLNKIDPSIINQAQYERLVEYIRDNQEYQ